MYPLVCVDDITLRIDDEWLFERTRWEIRSDQHWAIIGPTGSGKSLLVRGLCREIAIMHGRIRYFFDQDSAQGRSYFYRGEIVKISPDTHRDLMQQYAGYHQARWQSIEGNAAPTISDLLTGVSIERISPYDVTPTKVNPEIYRERRQRAVALLGIEYLLERKILHISNGEAQKVLIARALMQSPYLLILDDPYCGLDTASRATLRNAIDDLLAEGRPRVIFVTSRLKEIPEGITHVLGVANKQVVAQGPKNDILKSQFVREHGAAQATSLRPSVPQFPTAPREAMTKHSILIEMNTTTISYGGVDVLRDINWTMRRGENWAVLGPNGAGKTTLLSLILADNPQAYANDITIFGRKRGSGESIWEIKQRIGWVSPELREYYQGTSTCHNVVCSGFFDSIGLYRDCFPEQEQRATEWLNAFGIAHLAERPFGTVSVGEQRLTLLARAVVKQPDLLILDEPTQGLDALHRTAILELLDQLCRHTGVNLIYVTHHFDEMPAAITHILRLERGRIYANCELNPHILID